MKENTYQRTYVCKATNKIFFGSIDIKNGYSYINGRKYDSSEALDFYEVYSKGEKLVRYKNIEIKVFNQITGEFHYAIKRVVDNDPPVKMREN